MDLTHSFRVPAGLEETWLAFTDIEDVAGCFPGATITSVQGDDFNGTCKVKLGPISLLYTGSGSFVERDEQGHRFVVEATGKDKRGNGTAGATVTAVMTAADEATDVEVRTNLSITGRPAQFGRGVIQDVSDKLLQQFVACLEAKVTAPAAVGPTAAGAALTSVGETAGAREPVGAAAPDVAGAAAGTAGTPPDAGAGAAQRAAGTAPEMAPVEVPTDGAGRGRAAAPASAGDTLDLGATVLPVLLKAYWRQLAGALLTLVVVRWLVRRRGR